MVDVAFYEVFSEEKKAIEKYLPRHVKVSFTEKTVQEENLQKAPAGLISVRTQSKIPRGWSDDLKGVHARSTGYDHLSDYRKSVHPSIEFGYLPSYCSVAVAEHSILLMFAVLKGLKKQLKNFETFNRNKLTGQEFQGRSLLVVGVGYIGKEIVRLAKALGMHVKGFDIKQDMTGLEYVTLEEGIKWARAIVCALPLTEKTAGLLNYAVLKQAQPGFILVNVSRGEVTPIKDLKRLLEENILGGLGLDVFEEEANLAIHLQAGQEAGSQNEQSIRLLKDADNVYMTPHNAFNTAEALDRKARQSVDALISFLEHGKFPFSVPSPSTSA